MRIENAKIKQIRTNYWQVVGDTERFGKQQILAEVNSMEQAKGWLMDRGVSYAEITTKRKNWYRVYYTLHHGSHPNTGHDMYVEACNKTDAIKQCRAFVREKSDRYAFNCMAILDGPEKYDPRHMEKYVEWAKYYGVYKPEPEIIGRI